MTHHDETTLRAPHSTTFRDALVSAPKPTRPTHSVLAMEALPMTALYETLNLIAFALLVGCVLAWCL